MNRPLDLTVPDPSLPIFTDVVRAQTTERIAGLDVRGWRQDARLLAACALLLLIVVATLALA